MKAVTILLHIVTVCSRLANFVTVPTFVYNIHNYPYLEMKVGKCDAHNADRTLSKSCTNFVAKEIEKQCAH